MSPSLAVSEKTFLQQVKDLARLCGWRVYHTLDSRGSDPGFPDLCMARPPRVVFAELKSECGKLTPAQREWLSCLAACGVKVYVWTPREWEQVEATLQRPEAGR